jgi:hypothetical protein
MKAFAMMLAGALLPVCACSTSKPISENEVFVGQIAYLATSSEAATGFHYVPQPDEALRGVLPRTADVPPAKSLISACGQNSGGQFALVRLYYYWLNSGVAVVSFSPWTIAGTELPIARGNVVEVQLRPGLSNSRCAVITKVRTASLSAGNCEYRLDKKSALEATLGGFSPNGGPGAASLYCPFMEAEGWKAAHMGPSGDGTVWSKTPL